MHVSIHRKYYIFVQILQQNYLFFDLFLNRISRNIRKNIFKGNKSFTIVIWTECKCSW